MIACNFYLVRTEDVRQDFNFQREMWLVSLNTWRRGFTAPWVRSWEPGCLMPCTVEVNIPDAKSKHDIKDKIWSSFFLFSLCESILCRWITWSSGCQLADSLCTKTPTVTSFLESVTPDVWCSNRYVTLLQCSSSSFTISYICSSRLVSEHSQDSG